MERRVKKIIDYIEEIPKFAKKHSQEYMKEFLRFLGNPEKDKKIIHVAGTNGKGTVCAYLNAMLLGAGKVVGCFTSPHLVQFNERINICGQEITDEDLADSYQQVRLVIDDMAKEGLSHPSYFEFIFGIAMLAFHKYRVEYVILETGIGGRLDATNVIEKPMLSIITAISLDHQDILGETLIEVAKEKAGIIKEGVPVIYDAHNLTTSKVIDEVASDKQTIICKVEDSSYEVCSITEKSIAFSMRDSYYNKTIWNTKGWGIWQMPNAALALEAMRTLERNGELPKELTVWQLAMEAVIWPGRMQKIKEGLVLDGAHNLSAVEEFIKSVRLQKSENIVILFAAMQDKGYETMICRLCEIPELEQVIVTAIDNNRSVDSRQLKTIFRKYTKRPVHQVENISMAWREICRMDKANRTVYCVGSLYLIGEILKLWKEEKDVRF